MMQNRRRAGTGASLLAFGLLAAACSSGSSEVEASQTTPSTTARATTTTTMATTTTTMATTTTTEAVVAPLTGLPITDLTILDRPALVVKIDNHNNAVPQTGLNQADVVYEEIVEGITRFAAVFHSTQSDPVGPVRSGRTTDVDLIANLHHPLFAWSGGNRGVVAAIHRADLKDVGYDAASSLYYRERSRRAPHNLFTNTSALFALDDDTSNPPPALFTYREAGAPAVGGEVVAGVDINYPASFRVSYRWDPAVGGWVRSEYGKVHVDSADVPIAPPNVVILFTTYGRSPADPGSPEAQTVGEGEAWVLTDGQLIRGSWSRLAPGDTASLLDAAGAPILLTPGRTWVALPKPGGAEVIA